MSEIPKNPAQVSQTEIKPQPKTREDQPNGLRRLGNALKYKTITLGSIVSLLSAACLPNPRGHETVASPTQTAHTPGVNVIHATETPMPSQTATIETFTTPNAAKTEKQTGVNVILNPDVGGPFDAGLTAAQFTEKVTQIADQLLPKIDGLNFDIEIFQSNPNQPAHSYYENNGSRPRIRINSKESIEKLAFDIAHEWAHMATDMSYLEQKMSPERFQRFKAAVQKAVTDQGWGIPKNADPVPVLMTENMANVNFPITKDTPPGVVQATSQRYMASTLWALRTNPQDSAKNPFIDQIGINSPELAFLKEEFQKPEYQQQKIYESLDDFFNDPSMSNLFTRIATADPALSIGIDKLKKDAHYFAGNLIGIPADAPARAPILGSTKRASVELVVNAAMYEFAQKIRENDQTAVSSLNPAELSAALEFLDNVKYRAQNEGIADQIACYLLRPDLNAPAGAVIQTLKEK